MRTIVRVVLAGLVIGAVAVASVWVLSNPDLGKAASATRATRVPDPRAEPSAGSRGRAGSEVRLFGENYLDDSGNSLAFRYSAPIADRHSLAQCCASAVGRSRRGIAEVLSQLGQLEQGRPRPPDYNHRRAMFQAFIGLLHMYDGRFTEASAWFGKAVAENPGIPREERANLLALRGVAALRRGEIENCVACLGPSSCILPIARKPSTSAPTARARPSDGSPSTWANGLRISACAGC